MVSGTDRGTHQGEFMGYPPAAGWSQQTWIEIFRMESGKAVEGWVESDTRSLIEQLNA